MIIVIFLRKSDLILFIKTRERVNPITAPIIAYINIMAPPSIPVCLDKVSPATNAPEKNPPVKLKITKVLSQRIL